MEDLPQKEADQASDHAPSADTEDTVLLPAIPLRELHQDIDAEEREQDRSGDRMNDVAGGRHQLEKADRGILRQERRVAREKDNPQGTHARREIDDPVALVISVVGHQEDGRTAQHHRKDRGQVIGRAQAIPPFVRTIRDHPTTRQTHQRQKETQPSNHLALSQIRQFNYFTHKFL